MGRCVAYGLAIFLVDGILAAVVDAWEVCCSLYEPFRFLLACSPAILSTLGYVLLVLMMTLVRRGVCSTVSAQRRRLRRRLNRL